jgi:hypothetical protein
MESLLEQSDKVRQKGRYWRKIRNIIFLVFLFGFVCWGVIKYYYPVEEGIETGKIEHVVYKGLMFKTYEGLLIRLEGKMIKEGERSTNEFVFSVAKKDLAEKLMHAGGKTVELRYTKYLGAIPWRGKSRYIVNELIRISGDKDELELKDIINGSDSFVSE